MRDEKTESLMVAMKIVVKGWNKKPKKKMVGYKSDVRDDDGV